MSGPTPFEKSRDAVIDRITGVTAEPSTPAEIGAALRAAHAMKRKPRKIACPACKVQADTQPIRHEGIRTLQGYICDNETCPVSSFVIEWRSGAK